ncbi:MAG: hypothetical protein IT516_07370 [Burkholderiales bacterium]|nr:hypothetical protein [Burkholderiales bacterium]
MSHLRRGNADFVEGFVAATPFVDFRPRAQGDVRATGAHATIHPVHMTQGIVHP